MRWVVHPLPWLKGPASNCNIVGTVHWCEKRIGQLRRDLACHPAPKICSGGVPNRWSLSHQDELEVTTQTEPLQTPSEDNEDINHCFKCSDVCSDGEEREWIGCDTCYR